MQGRSFLNLKPTAATFIYIRTGLWSFGPVCVTLHEIGFASAIQACFIAFGLHHFCNNLHHFCYNLHHFCYNLHHFCYKKNVYLHLSADWSASVNNKQLRKADVSYSSTTFSSYQAKPDAFSGKSKNSAYYQRMQLNDLLPRFSTHPQIKALSKTLTRFLFRHGISRLVRWQEASLQTFPHCDE